MKYKKVEEVQIDGEAAQVRCDEPTLGEVEDLAGIIMDAYEDGGLDPSVIVRNLSKVLAVVVKDLGQAGARALPSSDGVKLMPELLAWFKTVPIDALVTQLKNMLPLVKEAGVKASALARDLRDSSPDSASSTGGAESE